ncbi:MAG: SCO family protein [Limisphaerales bacterium]
MRTGLLFVNLLLFVSLISFNVRSASAGDARVFLARGVVEKVQPEDLQIVIKHEAVSNYMDAMTMPFKVKSQNELAGLQRGDQINFQLHVTADESWVDHFSKTGFVKLPTPTNSVAAVPDEKFELLHYKFTNELGQAVSLSDFPGQALAVTFFYTRCPLPNACPRLSKNFEEAQQKLEAMTNAPTNWHFLSISFDPEFDSPAVLKAYGQFYQYDPAHWSFLTGPKDKIHELAARAGVTVQDSNGIINHNFRTLIIDASDHLQTVFPMTGDLSGLIVDQIIKAAAATNTTAR